MGSDKNCKSSHLNLVKDAVPSEAEAFVKAPLPANVCNVDLFNLESLCWHFYIFTIKDEMEFVNWLFWMPRIN